MKLTQFERTVLLNQFRILEKLTTLQQGLLKKPDLLTNDADWKDAIEVFQRGFEYDYEDYIALPDSDYDEKHGEEVSAILEMFEDMDRAGSVVRFEGFDGNREGVHRGYAERFSKTQRQFKVLNEVAALANARWNSHIPTLARYRRMMMVYKNCSSPLTAEAVAKIEAVADKPE